MSVNTFFIFIVIGLVSIFVFFKPLKLKEQAFIDIPLFELNDFTLYELDRFGLTTLMSGESTLRYSDRYEVNGINYTDNTKKYMANMKADYGIYQNDDITLNGNIEFIREDGFTFKTQKANYNKVSNLVLTEGNYTSFIDNNSVTGTDLEYYNELNRVKSKNVIAIYQLQESF